MNSKTNDVCPPPETPLVGGEQIKSVGRSNAVAYEDEPYKRFLIFGFDQYYPGGGIDDVQMQCDTIEEVLKSFVKSEHTDNYNLDVDGRSSHYDYIEVFDCEKRQHLDLGEMGIQV